MSNSAVLPALISLTVGDSEGKNRTGNMSLSGSIRGGLHPDVNCSSFSDPCLRQSERKHSHEVQTVGFASGSRVLSAIGLVRIFKREGLWRLRVRFLAHQSWSCWQWSASCRASLRTANCRFTRLLNKLTSSWMTIRWENRAVISP